MAFDWDQFKNDTVSAFAGLAVAAASAPAGPLVSMFLESAATSISNQALTALKEKQNQKKSSIVEICNQKIPKGSSCNEFKPLIIATVEICFDHYKSLNEKISHEFDAYKLAKEFVDKYIAGDPELESLSGILTEILSKVIQQYLEDLVKNPNKLVLIISSLQQIGAGQDKTIEELKINLIHLKEAVEQLSKLQALPSTHVKDRYEEYRSAWNERMFLHRGPRRPKLLLSDVYQVPRYDEDFTDPSAPWCNIHSHANTDLDQKLHDALDAREENKMLLVLGQPGSGKSTLITYLLNKHTVNDTRKIRVFRFRELGIEDWNIEPSKLPELILSHLSLSLDALRDSVLVLDGLDEVPMSTNHKSFMEALYKYWCSFDGVKNFSLFITCRLSRIPSDDIEHMSYITIKLCSLDSSQIDTFRSAYYLKTGENHTGFKLNTRNKDALGIPIILYLVLASHIDIGNSSSMVDIYERLFSISDKENSLYYRPYDDGIITTSDSEPIQIHNFCKEISTFIWECFPSEGTCDSQSALSIWKRVSKNDQANIHDVLTEQYFIEGAEHHEIYFIHRSIYEYFVAVSLYDEIQNLCKYPVDRLFPFFQGKSAGDHNPLTRFAILIGLQYLGNYPEISDYLLHMLKNSSNTVHLPWWDTFFQEFLIAGLADAVTSRNVGGIKGIDEEQNRCFNILYLMQLSRAISCNYKYLALHDDQGKRILKHCIVFFSRYLLIPIIPDKLNGLPLNNMDLSEILLNNAILKSTNFTGSNLDYANLTNASLEKAIFDGASLKYASLKHANLAGASFKGCILKGAHLEGAHLGGADLGGVSLKGIDLRYVKGLTRAEFDGLSKAELDQAILPEDFQLPEWYEVGEDGIIHKKSKSDTYNPIIS